MIAGSGGVLAQQANTGELAEIVVTAQKRTEDLQKVPISIQVLGGAKLAELQVGSFDDYAKFLPSVSFQTLGPGQAQLYFRGIASGGDGLHAGSASATGTYLDETPVTTINNSIDLHVYDIQRVEALAGPQGTLYGASSLSGTLRIITNKPDPSGFSAGYDVKGDKYSKGAGGGQFEGFVNIPLSENAAIRLVGYVGHDGGFVSNVPATRTYQRSPVSYYLDNNGNQVPISTGLPDAPLTISNAGFAKTNFNPTDTYGGRAALKIDLSDRWTVTPAVIYQHQKTGGSFAFDPKIGDLQVTDFTPDSSLDQWYQTALTVEGKISNYDLVYSGGYFERRTSIQSDYSEYSVAYDYNGYMRFRDNAGNLIDPTQAQSQFDRYSKLTNELRLSSPGTDRFRYVVGAFYQRQTDNIRDEFIIKGLGDNATWSFSVPGQAPNLYLTQQYRVDRDYALFGDATFDITDQLKLSAGIRGFRANNTLYGFFGFNNLFSDSSTSNTNNNGDNFAHGSGTSNCAIPPPAVVVGNLPCINTDKTVKESGQTHRVNLTYQIDPDRMIYATYSTGFRPGGNNRRVGLGPYASDTLSNYELGWKTSWFDRSLRFNGAVFYEDWKGVQLAISGPNGITDLFNVGNASVKGIESEIDWLVTEGLDISASATYVDAKTTSDFCGEDKSSPSSPTYGQLLKSCVGTAAAPSGSRLPVTPSFKGNATARYKFAMGDYKSYAQISVLHQSSANSDLQQDVEAHLGPTPAFTTADISFGTGLSDWNLEFYVDNAFDERGQLNRFGQCGSNYCYDNARVYPTKPRIFGVKFGQRFK
jgi:outer membrane receptor protein involved in Fe transport